MPGLLEISTKRLETLTPGDLEGVRIVDLRDPENLTEEHRLKLKEVADRRGLVHPLDVGVLNQKLENILSKSDTRCSRGRSISQTPTHTPSRTPSPNPEWEAVCVKRRQENEKCFRELIARGGRPAFPLELLDTHSDACGEYADIFNYWGGFRGQLSAWVYFHRFQRRNRKTAEIFAQYKQDVCDYRRNEGIEGDIHLLFDEKQQIKVDEWKEYQYFQHRKLAEKRAKAEEQRQYRKQERLKWENNDPTDPMIPGELYNIPMIRESELRRFMVLMNWIEDQLPKIAQEEALSHSEASGEAPAPPSPIGTPGIASRVEETASTPEETAQSKETAAKLKETASQFEETASKPEETASELKESELAHSKTKKTAKSTRNSPNRDGRSLSSLVLGAVGAPRVVKSSRKTKSSSNSLSDVRPGSPCTVPCQGSADRVTRTLIEAATPPAKHVVQHRTTPHRSQRTIDLATKRSPQQPDAVQEEAPQGTSKSISPRESKDQRPEGPKTSPQARPQGIKKRWVIKRNPTRSLKRQPNN